MAKSTKKKTVFSSEMNLETLKVKTTKSKIHTTINRKIKKLHKEKEGLELLKKKILIIKKEYSDRISPIQDKIYKLDEDTLLLFDKFRNKKSVSKRYKKMALDQIKQLIFYFSSVGYITPSISKLEKEMRQNDFNFSEEEETEAREEFKAMLDEAFEETGTRPDISFEDFKNMSMEDIMEKMQQQAFEEFKESEKETKHKIKEERHSYNDNVFKTMYKELAKLLHPDKQSSIDTIKNKEQLMKELSLAWEERNYLKLLEINSLINPKAEEIKLDKNHLKEIERHISEELAEIKEFKNAVKNNVTEDFYRYNQFYNILKSRRESNFKNLEQEMKEDILGKSDFNKNCFKSIKHTIVYLDEVNLDFDDEFMNEFMDGLMNDLMDE